jgi:hypothetical protein
MPIRRITAVEAALSYQVVATTRRKLSSSNANRTMAATASEANP